MTVAATVVVEFGHGVDSGALVVVELDEEMNLDLDGEVKTSFVPGDVPYFLVHHDATVRIGRIACSSGMVSGGNDVLRPRGQQLQWPNDDGQDLPHVPAGAVVWQWYGNSPVVTNEGRSMKVSGALPAIGEVSYRMAAKQYSLTPPPFDLAADESWTVLIVITMEAA